MRTAAKRDRNEPEIVGALLSLGVQVKKLSQEGIPDLLLAYRGRNYLAEVKDGDKKLTPAQVDFHALWRGPIVLLRSIDDVHNWVTLLSRKA